MALLSSIPSSRRAFIISSGVTILTVFLKSVYCFSNLSNCSGVYLRVTSVAPCCDSDAKSEICFCIASVFDVDCSFCDSKFVLFNFVLLSVVSFNVLLL